MMFAVWMITAGFASGGPGVLDLWDGTRVECLEIEPEQEGVTVRLADETTRVYAWQDVRTIAADELAQLGELIAQGRAAWRARARLGRGDLPAAEALLGDLSEAYAGLTGATAFEIHLGYARCLGARSARVQALEAWLLAREADESQDSFERGAEVWDRFDPELGLVASLPPIWIDGPAVRSAARARGAVGSAGQLRRVYRQSLRAAVGDSIETEVLEISPESPAVRVALEILRAQVSDAGGRLEARRRLRSRMDQDGPAFIAAWSGIAIGRSLLLETDKASRLDGVLSLLSVHVESGGTGYLGGLALADAIVGLRSMGMAGEAEILAAEFERAYPGHEGGEAVRSGVAGWLTRVDGRVGVAE